MRLIRIFFAAALGLAVCAGLDGQIPEWQWARGAGGMYWDEGTCLAGDSQGNVYVAGFFYESAEFGATVLTSSGDRDLFVAKLDPAGNWLWVKRSGGENLSGVAVDDTGNVYLSGYFWGTADFGPYTLIGSGSGLYDDIFVAKLDTDGNWLWAKRAGGINTDRSMGIALDSSGNVYVTGFFGYDAVIGGTNLNCAGAWDIFVAKLDPEGNWLWAVGAGGLGSEWGEDLVLDEAGNIYLTGSFQMTVTFGSTDLDCAGERDVLIAKLDPQGNWLWAKRAGGWHYDHGTAIAWDGCGSIFCAGFFRESGDYGNDVLTSAGSYDLFVCKLNTDGDWLWARREGGVESDQAWGIDLDQYGNVYLAGGFQSSVDIGQTTLISAGGYDILLASLDPAGNWLQAIRAGGVNTDSAKGIAFSGSVFYATGGFMESMSMGQHSLLSEGDYDVWIAKLNPNVEICDEVVHSAVAGGILKAWPNPFHSGDPVRIATDIKTGESGTLAIYNLSGQVVRTFPTDPGRSSFLWDGRDYDGHICASGIYFCRLSTPSLQLTRKLMFVK
ncbi:MAG TPA: SBBP repeat-containing protein [Candidatus Syntrophosphaera sp.]|nr:SBBP repeat-containing protein [Candidatus Syntrophosphaera sp.]